MSKVYTNMPEMRQHRSAEIPYGKYSPKRIESSAQSFTLGTPDIIASLDIGTTYSGYAFALTKDLVEDHTNVRINNDWISGNSKLITSRTPTSILLTPEKRFHSFGYEAEWKYGQLASEDNHAGWFYFRRFKMAVLNDPNLNTTTSITDDNGKHLRVAMVFSCVMKYFKTHIIDALIKTMKGASVQWIHDNLQFRWMIPYPATWSEPAQQCLKIAAKQAGLIDVYLVPKPVAASLYSHISPLHRINTRNGEIICLQRHGTKYAILDLGGGSVDIAVYQLNSDDTLQEVMSDCGSVYGGFRVDVCFLEFLIKLVGMEVFDKFAQKFRADLLQLHKEFEWKKRTFEPSTQEPTTIRIPNILRRIYEVNTKQPLQFKIEHSEYGNLVRLAGDHIHIDADIMRGFFTTASEQICSHVLKILYSPATRDVKTLVLVGGFASSPMMQYLVRKRFPDMTIVMPSDPDVAVMKGAVLYGNEFGPIINMKARYSYGIGIAMPFMKGDDPEEKKFKSNGVNLTSDIFHRHIKLGQTVRIGEFASSSSLYINRQNQRYLSIPVYLSNIVSPVNTSDNTSHFLGKIRLTLVANRKQSAPITVKMALTYSELIVEVTDEGSGKTVRDVFLDSPTYK